MAKRWSEQEERFYRDQLRGFYIDQNKTINEIADILGLAPATISQRLKRLGIVSAPERKIHYLNRRSDINIPSDRSPELAEFFGIMLGDGCLPHFQVSVTLGIKELSYAQYVAELLQRIFGPSAKIITGRKGYRIVYIGSTKASHWLREQGLVYNKVLAQVDVPQWIFDEAVYMQRFVRGFFDTDGSVYKLKYGIQLSFTNHSVPLLRSLQELLVLLGYRVSAISGPRFYITKICDVERFFYEIAPQNEKHNSRYAAFLSDYQKSRTGSPVGRGGGL